MATTLRLLCIAGLCLIVGGCGAESPTKPGEDRPVVLTTFTVLADIARNVAGEHLRVESITKVGSEIHGYEPTPGDMRRASEADLIVDNGLNLEAWFSKLISGLDVPHVVLSEGVDPIAIGEDAYSGQPNPHAWMSPLNAEIYVDNLVEAFSALMPAQADAFEENARDYRVELRKVHGEIVSGVRSLPPAQRALVTCEGAFSYLARDAGLRERYVWPVNAEQQATPRRVAAVIDFVDAHDVPAVFCESTVSDASMQRVVEATDATFGGVLYVDSLSRSDGPVPTYLDLLRHDVRTIVAGLTGEEPR